MQTITKTSKLFHHCLKRLTKLSFVGATGSNGLWNFFWFPTAPDREGAERQAAT